MRLPSPNKTQGGLALTLLAALLLALCLQVPRRAAAQTSGTLAISGSRPVADAIRTLVEKYGYVITYEDPRYAYQGDLQDATQYRRDANKLPQGRAPKLWVPLTSSVELKVPSSAKASEQDIKNSLEQLIQSQAGSNQGGGHFTVEEDSGAFHVVPIEARDATGNWQPVTSILAISISLPTQARTRQDTFQAICSAVSAKAGVKILPIVNSGVAMGAVPFGYTSPTYTLGAQNEPASSVLMRAFQLMGVKQTWLLFYEPTHHFYVLNIIDLPHPS